jgi:hypothetical protein
LGEEGEGGWGWVRKGWDWVTGKGRVGGDGRGGWEVTGKARGGEVTEQGRGGWEVTGKVVTVQERGSVEGGRATRLP